MLMSDRTSYSIEKVIKFLEDARDAQILKFNTARTRITALRKLKEFLPVEEQEDLNLVDISVLEENLRSAGSINEGTLQTYITRLKKSIAAYELYGPTLTRGSKDAPHEIGSGEQCVSPQKETLVIVLDGAVVSVSNLPPDLSIEQAERICIAVRGFAEQKTMS